LLFRTLQIFDTMLIPCISDEILVYNIVYKFFQIGKFKQASSYPCFAKTEVISYPNVMSFCTLTSTLSILVRFPSEVSTGLY